MKCGPLVEELGQPNCNITKNINKHRVTYSEYLLKLISTCEQPSEPVKIWHPNVIAPNGEV
jgi:proteasome lid subunit RPN8/RPN11